MCKVRVPSRHCGAVFNMHYSARKSFFKKYLRRPQTKCELDRKAKRAPGSGRHHGRVVRWTSTRSSGWQKRRRSAGSASTAERRSGWSRPAPAEVRGAASRRKVSSRHRVDFLGTRFRPRQLYGILRGGFTFEPSTSPSSQVASSTCTSAASREGSHHCPGSTEPTRIGKGLCCAKSQRYGLLWPS